MSVIDRHIFSEWIRAFGLVLGATLGVLVLEEMYGSFRNLLDYGASVREIIRYYGLLAPTLLPVVLPVSMLLSLLYSMGQLHRNNEFIALRAAGLGVPRITRSIWAGGFVLCVLALYLNTEVIPRSVEQSRRFWENLEYRYEAEVAGPDAVGMIPSVGFDHQRMGRVWFINRFSAYTNRAFGVSVSELDSERREKTRIMAREAYYDEVIPAWVFLDGREMWFDPEVGDLVRSVSFERREFPEFHDDPELMLMLGKDPKNLSFLELTRLIEYFRADENPRMTGFLVRYHSLLAGAFSSLVVIGLAIPFAVSGVRTNPAVGVSNSIGIFFAYYLSSNLLTGLAVRGTLDPWVAAWMPNVLMAGLAWWLFMRLR